MKSIEKLAGFLISRESDIANEMEDFGDLKEVFKELFEREPSKDPIQERSRKLK